MAHTAKLNELSEALVTDVTGLTRRDAGFRRCFDQTSKTLKAANYARTNPFEVQSTLLGLVEKFEILNRDDLAVGLKKRLDELPDESKWMPECLALLLLLSDKPAEKTRLEDLDVSDQQPAAVPDLTWEEIVDNDPHDSDIWDSIEHGYHSSGDEAAADEDDLTISTDATSLAEDDTEFLAKQHVVQVNQKALDDMRGAHQLHPDAQNEIVVSEYFLIRETLSMLHGLPSNGFRLDEASGRVSTTNKLSLGTAINSTVQQMLAKSAEIGSCLNFLRRWVEEKSSITYVQSCQYAIQQLLNRFTFDITALENSYLSLNTSIAVSIIEVQHDIERLAQPALRLSALLAESQPQMESNPFAYLDALVNEPCVIHMAGDTSLFDALYQVLLAGLRAYLRALSIWIQTGRTDKSDSMSLASEIGETCEVSEVWQNRFVLRILPGGQPSVPILLQPLAERIFALGKSRAFLNVLRHEADIDAQSASLPEFTTLLETSNLHDLRPFSETLTDTIESWIATTAKDCTPILRQSLLYDYGALKTFSGMPYIFCSKNGCTFQAFADAMFWRIDNKLRWHDEFLLTELAQRTLGSAAEADANSLTITFEEQEIADTPDSSIAGLGSLKLNLLFAPAAQNITRTKSSAAYSKAFTSLMQIYRAKSLLRNEVLDLRKIHARASTLPSGFRTALKLRQSLIVLVDVLHAHTTTTTESLSTSFCKTVQTADGIDSMVVAWAEHEKLIESSLLLAKNFKPVRNAITGILELCESFTGLWPNLISAAGAGGSESYTDVSVEDRVIAMRKEIDQSVSFLTAGVRSLSRAAENAALESLADSLQWSVHRSQECGKRE